MIKLDLIKRAYSTSIKSHHSSNLFQTGSDHDIIIISFPGLWSVNDFFTGDSFGQKKIDPLKFPALRSVGNDDKNEISAVNDAFLNRFESILPHLENQVRKAVAEGKQIVFAGHSSGGPIAILATVWFLEKYIKPEPLCVTFGSPLVGDRIFNHALKRENWSQYFTHFVMRYDILPRVLLSPVSSIRQELDKLLRFWNPKIRAPALQKPIEEAWKLYVNVMRNASSVASQAACHLMGNTNKLLETVSSFIQLSPYRPFGNYVFCTGNEKLVVVTNPDAVLQMLFYSSQLSSDSERVAVAKLSVTDHFDYERVLKSLERLTMTQLDKLEELPLSSDGSDIDTALNELGLGARARLSLRAAGELEKQKLRNQEKINAKKTDIVKAINALEGYKTRCEARKMSYYDAFKLSKETDDFNANVKRLELAGIWDEAMEMLKRYELPDNFERCKEWIDIGTKYRRIVEPLDIANYYRHLKNEDTGPYIEKGRPKRYRFTQRWREYDLRTESRESCFWAVVEELCLATTNPQNFQHVKGRVLQLENQVKEWIGRGEIGEDIFFEESTFVKWWKTLPQQHRSGSCIAGLMCK